MHVAEERLFTGASPSAFREALKACRVSTMATDTERSDRSQAVDGKQLQRELNILAEVLLDLYRSECEAQKATCKHHIDLETPAPKIRGKGRQNQIHVRG